MGGRSSSSRTSPLSLEETLWPQHHMMGATLPSKSGTSRLVSVHAPCWEKNIKSIITGLESDLVATAGEEGEAKLWNIKTGECVCTFDFQQDAEKSKNNITA